MPTSVCVATTNLGGQPWGTTVGTLTSVSLAPPLVAIFFMRSSRTLHAVEASGSFAVSVLSADQAEICALFGNSGVDRFSAVAWHPGPNGDPHIAGSLAHIDCTVSSVATVGDHRMVLGAVLAVEAPRPEASPLVHHRGGLTTVSRLDPAERPTTLPAHVAQQTP